MRLPTLAPALVILGLAFSIGVRSASCQSPEDRKKEMLAKVASKKFDDVRKELARADESAKAAAGGDLKAWDKAKNSLDKAFKMIRECETMPFKDSPEMPKIREEWAKAHANAYQTAEPALEPALAAVDPPQDEYKGDDLEKLRELVKAEWAKSWPKDEVLAIRFFTNEWKTTKEAKIDLKAKSITGKNISVMVAGVIVKQTDKLATMFAAELVRNNDTGDVNAYDVKYGVYTTKDYLVSKL